MLSIAASLVCVASGFLIVRLGWRNAGRTFAAKFLQFSLAVGFGIGIYSLVFLVVGVSIAKLGVSDAAVCCVLFYFVWRRRATQEPGPQDNVSSGTEHWCSRVLLAVVVMSLVCAGYAAIMRVLAHPHGDGWDAFAIWNLHARFLFFDGAHWREGFSPLIPWSHPDYPLLLPAAIAHFWTLMGRDSQIVPVMIGLLFTFGTAGVLISSLSILRGRTNALLAGMALLSTPAFIEIGTWQYADVPLSFFFLGTAVLICLHENERSAPQRGTGLLWLAGLSAAFATWTKNEGLLFFCALIAAYILVTLKDSRRASDQRGNEVAKNFFWPFLLGAMPVLLVVLYFKRTVAPPNELFIDTNNSVHKFLTGARYWAVIQWFVKQFFRFGHWLWTPITLAMVGYYFAIGKENQIAATRQVRILRLTLLFTLAGYAVIYLNTPYEIYWHLRFSLNRLFLQLWPTAVFLFFLCVRAGRTPEAQQREIA